MSLESAIENHALAVQQLAQAILTAAGGKPHKDVKKAEAPAAVSTVVAAAPAAASGATISAPGAAVALTYDSIKLPFLELVKAKSRDIALAAIAPHKSLKEIETQPDLFPGLLAAITKALV